ncbi:DUF1573 domain-containing protein [Flavobacterium sharifuzzamanii]|uniref:DUF1573 domain-containing protein n=1 Tax=Flavobacterium sharifuzzamanii TaxID=2211133 RepID=UPI000DAB8F93|nr:DUF1573 domain-containing protein [Flavobacterium sharifuzzamanii]KAF2080126.1 DUF1573 domain-containing protein [Flavobacterium sharifuzzamanii]
MYNLTIRKTLMVKKAILLIGFVALFFSSCTDQKIIYAHGTLDSVFKKAKEENKWLLVIFENEGCQACENLVSELENKSELKDKLSDDFLVYENKLNAIGNEYLSRALYSIASPAIYIFNADGVLINMLVGFKTSKEIQRAIEEGQNLKPVSGGFASRLNLDGRDLIDFGNLVLRSARTLEKKSSDEAQLRQTAADLKRSLNMQTYFFNNYLLAKVYQRLGDTEKAKQFAAEAMTFTDSFSIFLYQPLRNELRFLLDSRFEKEDEAFAVLDKNNYDFAVQKIGSRPEATFKVKNSGKKPLIVEKVFGNCDCMDFEWTKTPIMPGETGAIKVVYRADHQGGFSKTVYIFSNALNTPSVFSIKGVID